MKTVVYNIGCKVNQCECDSLITGLKELGDEVSEELVAADRYIINTCAVTKEAERKSRQCISRVRKLNNNADIYIIGCAAQKNAEQFEIKGVKYVSGVAAKDRVLQFIEGTHIEPLPTEHEYMQENTLMRTRAYVKIQDGCNNFCSYCIIPYLRGRSRSRSIESILSECLKLAQNANEIVITGINVSDYGKDIGTSLTELIKALKAVPVRIRLGSIEANVIDDEFMQAVMENGNICPHFHLSLQSGDEAVLKAMNRHYTPYEYYDKVTLIRNYIAAAAITTDIIVGFPTETEETFAGTLDFVQKVGFANIHIFPYSRRHGTASYPMGELDAEVVKKRVERLRKVKAELKSKYESSYVGSDLNVLIECNENFYSEGYSENYIRVYIADTCTQAGEIYKVHIEREHNDGLLAK